MTYGQMALDTHAHAILNYVAFAVGELKEIFTYQLADCLIRLLFSIVNIVIRICELSA